MLLNLENITKNIQSLPTLPTVYGVMTRAMENPLISNEKIAEIISADQSTAFKILKVANSPFYGFRGKIDTVTKAILYLGLNEVKDIVLSLSVTGMFSGSKNTGHLDPKELWAHSIAVGILARMIAQAHGIREVENYFLAGILHDIGKLVLLKYAPNEYKQALSLISQKKCLIREAEIETFGFDHSEIGKILAEKWKLPENIISSIAFHHSGESQNSYDLFITIVHLADCVARLLQLGNPGDTYAPQPNIRVWEKLKLPSKYFLSVSNKIYSDFSHTVSVMLN
jgi:putative nucleotidyltransferase with HDIG domain